MIKDINQIHRLQWEADGRAIYDGKGNFIARVWPSGDENTDAGTAKLMAAAPWLMEQLEVALLLIGRDRDSRHGGFIHRVETQLAADFGYAPIGGARG